MNRSNGPASAFHARSVTARAVKFRRLACALLAPALVAAVGGCASQSSGSSQGPVSMSIGIAAPTSAPVYIADALGYFKKQGLNVNVKIIPNAYLSIAAGQIQYGLVGVS